MVEPEADEIIETWLLKDFKTVVFGKKKKKETLFLFFPPLFYYFTHSVQQRVSQQAASVDLSAKSCTSNMHLCSH